MPLPIRPSYSLYQLFDKTVLGTSKPTQEMWDREIDDAIKTFKRTDNPHDIIIELLELIGDERLLEAARQKGWSE